MPTRAQLEEWCKGKSFGRFAEEGSFQQVSVPFLIQQASNGGAATLKADYARHTGEVLDYVDDAKWLDRNAPLRSGVRRIDFLRNYLGFCEFVSQNGRSQLRPAAHS